jgi:hypothetical protein
MAAADPLAALIAFLLTDSDVSGLVDARVYGVEVPGDDVTRKAMPQACIVAKPAGGPGGREGLSEWGRSRIDLWCYGANQHEGWNVYLAAYGALKHLKRTVSADVLLHAAVCLSKGVPGIDPDTQWPVTLSSWLVTASEVAAA